MYKILIVDDERPVVSWLYELLTRSLPFEADIYTAYSAIDALKTVDKVLLDIVISDIRMPRMSGLELMRYIHGKRDGTHIIFLTGYNEFDSVYEAIGHDNVQYLLKTEDDEALLEAISKSVSLIEAKRRAVLAANRQDCLLRLLKTRDMLIDLSNNAISFDSFMDSAPQASLAVNYKAEIYLAVGCVSFTPEKRYDMLTGLYLLATEVMGPGFHMDQADYGDELVLWFIQAVTETDGYEVVDRLDRLIMDAAGHLELEMAIVVSGETFLPESLPLILPAATTQVKRLAQMGSGAVAAFDHTEVMAVTGDQIALKLSSQFSILRQLLEQDRRDDCLSLLCTLLEPLERGGSMNDVLLLELYLSVALTLLSFINASRIAQSLPFRVGLGRLSRCHDFSGWPEAADYLLEVCESIFDEMKENPAAKRGSVVTAIIRFVENNLDGDLSLTAISRELHYNASYISRLFKAEYGQNLFDYISELRLVRAADALSHSLEPIYSVAKSVGFDNPPYFTKVFKRTYGVTPQEYRERGL